MTRQMIKYIPCTIILEIFIQDFLVFLIFMVFNFSFLYWNLINVKIHFQVSKFMDSNENYMTMKMS